MSQPPKRWQEDRVPAWSPNGKWIAFASNRSRNVELYALDLRTLGTRRLTSTPDSNETLPRIASDGRFAFVVPLDGAGSRIVVANAPLRGRRVLRAGTAVDWRPRATPAGWRAG